LAATFSGGKRNAEHAENINAFPKQREWSYIVCQMLHRMERDARCSKTNGIMGIIPTQLRKLLLLALIIGPLGLKAQFLNWDFIDMVTDSVQSGAYADMKIGPDGTLHISYWHRIEDKLIYAWKSPGGTTWNREYVDITQANGFRSSIALNHAGQVYIAYYEDVNGTVGIRYARRNGPSQWTIEPLPDIYNQGYGDYGPLGSATSKERIQHSLELIFDENNQPQIAFFDGYMKLDAFPQCTPNSRYGFKLHQAFRVNGNWIVRSLGHVPDHFLSCGDVTPDTLPHGDRYGEYCDLLLAPDGSLETFSLSRFNNEVIRHRTLFPYVDTVWVKSSLDISYQVVDTTNINIGSWWFKAFFTFDGISAHASPDDFRHVAYGSSLFYGENFCCTSLTNDLVYTRISPSGAITRHEFGLGTHRSYTDILTRGGSDSLFIVYADVSNLYFILQESADSGNTWAADTIMPGIGIGRSVMDIYQDSLNVLLFDAQRESLVLCKRHVNGGAWRIERVTFSESRGQSLDAEYRIAANDTTAHIAFNDGYSGELYYATGRKSQGWSWTITEPDANASGVIAISEALTTAGEPVIAYNGGENRDLRIAIHDNAGWHVSVIDSGGNPQFTDVAITNGDSIFVAFYEGNQNCLHRARKQLNDVAWRFDDIDCDSSAVGLYPSMKLDASGVPHVAYYNDNDRALYYAKLNTSTWQWDKTHIHGGSASAIGKYANLQLTANGLPKIAYLDEQYDGVWLAEQDQFGNWDSTKVDSVPVQNIGRPIEMQIDQFGKVWLSYNFYSNFERIKLMRDDGTQWTEVGVSSTGRVANEFVFRILGGDLFFVGKKNEIQNTGVAMLYAKNGLFVDINGQNLLSYNVSIVNFPNPSQALTTFRLDVKQPTQLDLRIYDLAGRQVETVFENRKFSTGSFDFGFDTRQLAPGVYLYALTSASGRTVQKLIVAR
jgi:hypothetical protein